MENQEYENNFEEIVNDVNETEEVVEEEEIEEDTVAANSIKTHASADQSNKGDGLTTSKVEMMKNMAHLISGMAQVDAEKWYRDTLAVFGPGKDYGVGDKSAQNSSTIDTKLGKGPKTKDGIPHLDDKGNPLAKASKVAYEDVQTIFQGEDLSEEFKEKAETIFEAAVNFAVTTEVARLEETYESALVEEVEAIAEEMASKLDTYLDYVVENWMKENEVAIESTLRNEIMEEFIDGLKGLFAEHYINVPEDKIDVLESLANKVETLEETLDEVITENAELRDVLVVEAKNDIFAEIASDLALTQQEKFAALAEGIEFDGDLEVFEKKLQIVKENYFGNSTAHVSNINEETFEGEVSGEDIAVDPAVNRYVQAIARTVKK